MSTEPGHVFVVHGSLTSLACDDVLVPTDSGLDIRRHWWPLLDGRRPRVPDDLGITAEQWLSRRHALVPWTGAGEGPRVWLVATGGTGVEPVDWYLEPVRKALRSIRSSRKRARRKRSRPLVALPLVGVGAGGMAYRRGDVITRLLDLLDEQVEERHDIALVLREARDHAAVQNRRRKKKAAVLHGRAEAVALDLAERAKQRELALFLGAGVSASAGLPLWSELISALLAHAEASPRTVRNVMSLGDPRDQATIAVKTLKSKGLTLHQTLNKVLPQRRYGLAHALLAALPIDEVTTTNYDGLFEAARKDQRSSTAVLPFQDPGPRWLLKLHGDLRHEKGIVLTRDDYLRFGESGGALAGVVQQMLLTKHLLFAGFSFTDENFFRLAHGARRALEDVGRKPRLVGTALELHDQPIRQRLWEGELTYYAVGAWNDPTPTAARKLEIFLDRVACHSADDASFLLDPAYSSLHDKGDENLAQALRGVAPLAAGDGPGRAMVRDLLARLGGSPRDAGSED